MQKTPNFIGYHIRKWYCQFEDTLANETGQLADGFPLASLCWLPPLPTPTQESSVKIWI